jgi:hypothetical protein
VVKNATAHGANSGANCRPQRLVLAPTGERGGGNAVPGDAIGGKKQSSPCDLRPTQQEPLIAGPALSG